MNVETATYLYERNQRIRARVKLAEKAFPVLFWGGWVGVIGNRLVPDPPAGISGDEQGPVVPAAIGVVSLSLALILIVVASVITQRLSAEDQKLIDIMWNHVDRSGAPTSVAADSMSGGEARHMRERVRCRSCGTLNRVPRDALVTKCGKCGESLQRGEAADSEIGDRSFTSVRQSHASGPRPSHGGMAPPHPSSRSEATWSWKGAGTQSVMSIVGLVLGVYQIFSADGG